MALPPTFDMSTRARRGLSGRALSASIGEDRLSCPGECPIGVILSYGIGRISLAEIRYGLQGREVVGPYLY